MYLTIKNQLRGLSVQQYKTIRELCRISKNFYNEAMYVVRQHYFETSTYLTYNGIYNTCKTNENYKMLGTEIGQQVLHLVDQSFLSFFATLRKAKSGQYQTSKCRLPNYLPKDSYLTVIIPRIRDFDNGLFHVPTSIKFRKIYSKLKLPFSKFVEGKNVCQVQIIPKQNAKYFEIAFVYKQEKMKHEFNKKNFLGIDIGVDNLATCVTNDGASFILDGKQIKSYNRLYNKENARLQSIKDKQGIKGITKQQYLNLRKRNRRVNQALSTASSKIVRYCIKHKIGNLVVGYNPMWKKGINIGKTNNQNFVQIPHGTFRSKLEYLCELHGIKFIEQEESYTSKSSFFDNDQLPSYNADNPQEYEFSGKRISRGQYRTKSGYVFNADVNGALNILRKCNLVSLRALQDRGCVSQPYRIRLF